MFKTLGIAAASLIAVTAAYAQGTGTGPVATACKAEITKYCANKGHGDRQTRTCLEANVSKLSADCKTALDTTGGGKGRK